MVFIKTIPYLIKLALITVPLQIYSSQSSLDSFLISGIRLHEARWPLEPGGNFTINRISYKVGENIMKNISNFFNCYVIRYKSNFFLVEPRIMIHKLSINSTSSKQSDQSNPINCEKIELDNVEDVYVYTDSKNEDHLFGTFEEKLFELYINNCNVTYEKEATVKAYNIIQLIFSFSSQGYFYYLNRKSNSSWISRGCINKKNRFISTTVRIKCGESDKAVAATVTEFIADGPFLVVAFEDNLCGFLKMDLLDHGLTEAEKLCTKHLTESKLFSSQSKKFEKECKEEKYYECQSRELNPDIWLGESLSGIKISSTEFTFNARGIISLSFIEQKYPIQFSALIIVGPETVYLLQTENHEKVVVVDEKLPESLKLSKLVIIGGDIAYFTSNSNDGLKKLSKISLPCSILEPIECFMFEKKTNCGYNKSKPYCFNQGAKSNEISLETNQISIYIEPSSAVLTKKRTINIQGYPIFHDWYEQKLRETLKVNVSIFSNSTMTLKHKLQKESNYSYTLLFSTKKILSGIFHCNLSISFEFEKLGKRVQTKKKTLIFLNPSIIKIVPDYTFPKLKNAKFLITLETYSRYFSRYFNFYVEKQKFNVLDASSSSNSTVFRINATLQLHDMMKPQKSKVKLKLLMDTYSEYDFEIKDTPKLYGTFVGVTFSEALLSFQLNGSGFNNLHEPFIRLSGSSVNSSCTNFSDTLLTCKYPYLSDISKIAERYFFLFSHEAVLSSDKNLQIHYWPTPTNFYAYSKENYVELSANCLHYSYPIKIVLTKNNNSPSINCNISHKIIDNSLGSAHFYCHFEDELLDSSDWTLTVKIGSWVKHSIKVNYIPRPADESSLIIQILKIIFYLSGFLIALGFAIHYLGFCRKKIKFRKLIERSTFIKNSFKKRYGTRKFFRNTISLFQSTTHNHKEDTTLSTFKASALSTRLGSPHVLIKASDRKLARKAKVFQVKKKLLNKNIKRRLPLEDRKR